MRVVLRHINNRTEADYKRENVEITNQAGGHKHRFTRLFGIGHGKETHQNMRQAGRAEHQRQAQRERINRIFHQAPGLHNAYAFFMNLRGFGKHIFQAEAGAFQNHEGHKRCTAEQQHRFDHLHPSSGQHAAEEHITHHQNAHDKHRPNIIHAKQKLNQFARAHNLRNQVENHHQKRARSGKHTHRRLLQAISHHIGEGEFTKVAQPLGHQEKHNRPAHQKAGGINQAVVAAHKHHGRNAQKRGCRHIIARNRQAVLKAGNTAAGRVEIFGRLILLGCPLGDKQRSAHKNQKHHHRGNVQRLLLHFAANRIGPRIARQRRCGQCQP